jgi:iron(III) transport system permease protein
MSTLASRGVFLTVTVFFLLFFVLPIWGALRGAFLDAQGGLTFDYLLEVFRNPIYREGLINSFLIAVQTTLGCVLLAVPLAFGYVRYEFPGRGLCNGLLLTPLILPPFVGALGVQAILGQAGALNSLLVLLGLVAPDQPHRLAGGRADGGRGADECAPPLSHRLPECLGGAGQSRSRRWRRRPLT